MPSEDSEREDRSYLGHVAHLVRHSALLLASGVISYVGTFVLFVLLARVLGKAGFGTYAVAFTMTTTTSILGLMGADWLLVRQGSYYETMGDRARLRKTIYLAVGIGGTALVIAGAVLFTFSSWIAVELFHRPSLAPLLKVVSAVAPIMGLSQIMLFGTQAFKTMRDFSLIRNVLLPVARLLSTAIAVAWFATAFSAMVGLLIAEACILLVATLALNRRVPLLGSTEAIDFKGSVRFALPTGGTKIAEQTRFQAFPLLLGSLTHVSASGVYVISQRIAHAPTSVIAAMVQVFRPLGSDLFLRNRREEFIALFKSIGKWSFTLAFPLFCLQVAFPRELLAIFGRSFVDASGALVLLSIAMLLNYGTGPTAPTLIISGRPRLLLADYAIVIVTELALAFWLIPAHGVVGAAIARTAGGVLLNGLVLFQVWSKLGFHPYRLDYLKPIAAGAAAVVVSKLVVSLVPPASGLVVAGIAVTLLGITYAAALLGLGLVEEDRAAMGALMRGVRARMLASL